MTVVIEANDSEEVVDVEALGLRANEVAARPEFRCVLGTMLAARQLYSLAVDELARLVRDAGEDEKLLMVFTESLARGAAQSFSPMTLARGFKDTVFPWMIETVNRRGAEAHEAYVQGQIRLEEERRARPVGFPGLQLRDEPMTFPRNRPVVVAGWRSAVLYVLDQLCAAAQQPQAEAEPGRLVIRLASNAGRSAREELCDSSTLIRVTPVSWAGCANNERTVAELCQAHLAERATRPVELFVVDDLTQAHNAGILGRDRVWAAKDAEKNLARVCEGMGALLVGGVFLDVELGDHYTPIALCGHGWEEMHKHTTVLEVKVNRRHASDEVYVQLTQNEVGLCSWQVPLASLEMREGPRVILS